MKTIRILAQTAALAGATAACSVGPDYVPALAPIPEKFKELKGKELKGWKVAAPRESVDADAWWLVYKDPCLDALERQVEISNQTVASAAAAYEEARTSIRIAQAALFPTITAGYSITRQYTGARLGRSGSASPNAGPSSMTAISAAPPDRAYSRKRRMLS